MKNENLIKKIGCIVLVLLLCCISHLSAEPGGDVNSDGGIDIVDALLIAQYYVGLYPENFDQEAADVKGDGTIDIIDALLIAQYYVGLITSLTGCVTPTEPPILDDAIVVVFIIDGLQPITAATAANNGAENLKMVIEQGVTVTKAYCVSPSPSLVLPDGSKPWGGTTAPNVAIHTGCHLFESKKMDDIFLAARDAGIMSVFTGGANSYSGFKTADFNYASDMSDEDVVTKAIQHLKNDGVRLLRLHLQRIRDDWKGPNGRTDPNSDYIKAVLNADRQLGRLIDELKAANVWEKTYLIVSADHGMGNSSSSSHPANEISSWDIFMGFYGPGIKNGETIPYAESPDMAIMSAHFLGLRPLMGHTDPEVTIDPKGITAILLTNIFEGGPETIDHPQFIYKYLESKNFKPGSDYLDYRTGILNQLNQ